MLMQNTLQNCEAPVVMHLLDRKIILYSTLKEVHYLVEARMAVNFQNEKNVNHSVRDQPDPFPLHRALPQFHVGSLR
ncbi:hypothetical protein SDC9_156744 [bioreactor metagenome]|uniref:Uncharacterized protein n=1 Tax=bioreactor metagenome TaxID=1076179 RepID=A0A645FA70_9ZZZZ